MKKSLCKFSVRDQEALAPVRQERFQAGYVESLGPRPAVRGQESTALPEANGLKLPQNSIEGFQTFVVVILAQAEKDLKCKSGEQLRSRVRTSEARFSCWLTLSPSASDTLPSNSVEVRRVLKR